MSDPVTAGGVLLSEPWQDDEVPWLDRAETPELQLLQQQYREDGFVVVPGWKVDDLMADLDEYAETWQRDNADHYPQGYGITGYMDCDVLRRICCNSALAWAIERLVGEECGVHLNLTNWRSTQRNWHQDGYLNPDLVRDHYIAAWIAVDDVHPDAGPFEFVRGSHRLWDPIRHDAMLAALGEDGSDPDWPYRSEYVLTPYFNQQIAERELVIEQFVPAKGEVLLWHPRLLHRGSPPRDGSLERRAIIAHYSGINHRYDMPAPLRYGGDHVGHYFPIGATA